MNFTPFSGKIRTLTLFLTMVTGLFAAEKPKINGAWQIGAGVGKPFLFLIPTTGDKPLTYSVTGLPAGLSLDAKTGQIRGKSPSKSGAYALSVSVENAVGKATRDIKLVVGDTLCLLPPMGWNSYNSYRNEIHEKEALENLEIFARDLAPHGYEYFVIDLGWYTESAMIPGTDRAYKDFDWHLDENGYPLGSRTYFPHGMKAFADEAHRKGVKFGLHLMRGMLRKAWEFNLPVKGTQVRMRDIADTKNICKWYPGTYGVDTSKPGAQEYYDGLIQHMADIGVDLIKYDDLVPFPAEIAAIRKAIDKCGRDIVLSLSPGNFTTPELKSAYQAGNMLRITGDVWDRKKDLEKCFDRWKVWQGAGIPGFWPDLDMLSVGTLTKGIDPAEDMKHIKPLPEEYQMEKIEAMFFRDCRLTLAQERTFMTMRALAASPLFMGGCLKRSPKRSFDLITQPDLLACDQNGITGKIIFERDGVQIWKTENQRHTGYGWLGIFNTKEKEAVTMKFSIKDLGLPDAKAALRSVWAETPFALDADTTIGADDVVFLEYGPAE